MPDHRGKLTESDVQKVEKWFARHWKQPVLCPVCRSDDWGYGTHVVQTPRLSGDAFVSGGITEPYVPVSCQVCGHTLFLAAVKMGVCAFVPDPEGA